MDKKKKYEESLAEVRLLRNSYQGVWRDNSWIKTHIGEYYTEDPAYEYYWTLIGDNYLTDWKGNIKLEIETYRKVKEINNSKILKPSKFLSRKFKNLKGYSSQILDETYISSKIESSDNYGVYAILADEEIIYIGSTTRSFDIRIKEHKDSVKSGSEKLKLYSIIRQLQQEKKKISWRPIVNCRSLKTNKIFTKDDIESMELAFISYFQPIGNLAGKEVPFRYSSAETH